MASGSSGSSSGASGGSSYSSAAQASASGVGFSSGGSSSPSGASGGASGSSSKSSDIPAGNLGVLSNGVAYGSKAPTTTSTMTPGAAAPSGSSFTSLPSISTGGSSISTPGSTSKVDSGSTFKAPASTPSPSSISNAPAPGLPAGGTALPTPAGNVVWIPTDKGGFYRAFAQPSESFIDPATGKQTKSLDYGPGANRVLQSTTDSSGKTSFTTTKPTEFLTLMPVGSNTPVHVSVNLLKEAVVQNDIQGKPSWATVTVGNNQFNLTNRSEDPNKLSQRDYVLQKGVISNVQVAPDTAQKFESLFGTENLVNAGILKTGQGLKGTSISPFQENQLFAAEKAGYGKQYEGYQANIKSTAELLGTATSLQTPVVPASSFTSSSKPAIVNTPKISSGISSDAATAARDIVANVGLETSGGIGGQETFPVSSVSTINGYVLRPTSNDSKTVKIFQDAVKQTASESNANFEYQPDGSVRYPIRARTSYPCRR